MMIQQQGYPNYVGSQISPGSRHSMHDETSPPPPSPPSQPISAAVRVIKENDSIRNVDYKEHKRTAASPVDKSPYRRSPSPPSHQQQHHHHHQHQLHHRASAFEPVKLIKRSNSIDNDEPLYDAESDDQTIRPTVDCDAHDVRYDSEPERDQDSHEVDYRMIDNNTDDDGPLDLSVSAGRRRDRTYSGTESDDSGGIGEEKVGGKAAYKKSLMKRYCKYRTNYANAYHAKFTKIKLKFERLLLRG